MHRTAIYNTVKHLKLYNKCKRYQTIENTLLLNFNCFTMIVGKLSAESKPIFKNWKGAEVSVKRAEYPGNKHIPHSSTITTIDHLPTLTRELLIHRRLAEKSLYLTCRFGGRKVCKSGVNKG